MKALVKKELREYAALWGIPLFLCVSKMFERGLGERFLAPSLFDQLVNVLVMIVPAAALLGFAQMVREGRNGTLSYLVHRELGSRQVIAAKAVAGLLMVAWLAFLPLLASYLSAAVFSPLRDVLQPMRLVEELCLATAAFAGYGAGVLAATLRGRPTTRGVTALGAGLGVVLLAAWGMAVDALSPTYELVLFPLVSFGTCAGLLGAASLAPIAWAGRESAVRGPRAGVALPRALAVLALLLPTAWFATSVTSSTAAWLASGSLPAIVAVSGDVSEPRAADAPSTSYRVLGPGEQSVDVGPVLRERYEPVYAEGTELPGVSDNAGGLGARWWQIPEFPTPGDLSRARREWPTIGAGGERAVAPRTQIAGAWIDLDAGVVRVLCARAAGLQGTSEIEMVALTPADGPLSPRTFVVDDPWGALYGDARAALLLDPERKALYVLRDGDEAPRLDPLDLPGGDTLAAWEPGRGRPYTHGDPILDTLVLRGERGDFVWRDGALVMRADEPGGLAGLALASTPPTEPWLRSDHDRLRPVREVVAPDGAVLLRVEHEIHGARRIAEGAALALELLRSPVVSVVSYLGDDDPERVQGHVFRAPLLVGGRRAWLLAVHVGLALVLATLAWSRLGGRRASAPRAALWGLAILAIGPVAFAAHVLCEPVAGGAPARAPARRMLLATKPAGV